MNKNLKINAEPTKEFFITMLIRDVPLNFAILDLIDNSIDGAIGMRGNNGDYVGLYVNLKINPNLFSIEDNCGGFSVEQAQNYAFRFGRPRGVDSLDHSVGRFGVGMKRAMFKMGNKFYICSNSEESFFEISEDINEWLVNDEWSFTFLSAEESSRESERGTTIIVNELHQGIAEQFSLSTFVIAIKKEIEKRYELWIDRGLNISVNGYELKANRAKLFLSDTIKPAYYSDEFDRVGIKLFAGITEAGSPKEAGWYIYCNGRLIVQADQTELSGWGDQNPTFHPQYAMFRGFAYFDADDSFLLPWNTTKSGIDRDSAIFIAARFQMKQLMRPVLDFLKKLKISDLQSFFGEGEEIVPENEELEEVIKNSKTETVASMNVSSLSSEFQSPEITRIVTRQNDSQKIQYSKPIQQINKIKDVLGVTSAKDVGEKTFDYFYKLECED